jgi:hypothetical protein
MQNNTETLTTTLSLSMRVAFLESNARHGRAVGGGDVKQFLRFARFRQANLVGVNLAGSRGPAEYLLCNAFTPAHAPFG